VGALAMTTVALAALAYAQAVSKASGNFGEGSLLRRLAVTAAAFAVGENPPVPDPAWLSAALRATGVLVLALGAAAIVLALRASEQGARSGARTAFVVTAVGLGAPIALAIV